MNRTKFIEENIKESAAVSLESISACSDKIIKSLELIVGSFRNRGKLLLCGNGGSAADAQHLAAELVIRMSHTIKRPGLPAIALSTDSSILTAGGNDIGYDNVFSRQIEALGHPEDVLFIMSTSGNSPNLLNALKMAKSKNIKSIGFLGQGGGSCGELVSIAVNIPSSNVQRIQEIHILLGHILIELIERELYQLPHST